MAKLIKEMPLVGKSAMDIAHELNLPHDFISEVLHEHLPRTYGELLEILDVFHKQEIVSLVRERKRNEQSSEDR